MSAARGHIGFERKIGYSFVGLFVGNLASAVVLALIVVLPHIGILPQLSKLWNPAIPILLLVIAMVSMLEWVLIGLPVVLILRAQIVADFYWATAAFIGGVLGTLGMLLFCVLLDGSLGTVSNLAALRQIAWMFADAALIAAVTFVVYCSLIKTALRRQTKESGAPNGAPRSLPWFRV